MIHKTDLYYNAGLEVSKNFSIESIEEDDIDYIIEMCVKLFSEVVKYDYPGLYLYVMTDFSISKKAVLDGKIIGSYLLNEESIHSYAMTPRENLDPYKTRRGLQGVALGLAKEHRGLTYGRQLRDSILSTGEYDYIWGLQGKQLNNLGNWLDYGRRLVGETEDNFVTLMDLAEEARMIA